VAIASVAIATIAAPARAEVPHVVQPGETLWSIAASNNFTTRTIAVYNGLSEDAQVYAGETIQIPSEAEGAAALAAAPASSSARPGGRRIRSCSTSPPGARAIACWSTTGSTRRRSDARRGCW
jgi:LysM repeat protein